MSTYDLLLAVQQLRSRGGVRVTKDGTLHEIRALMLSTDNHETPVIALDSVALLVTADDIA